MKERPRSVQKTFIISSLKIPVIQHKYAITLVIKVYKASI